MAALGVLGGAVLVSVFPTLRATLRRVWTDAGRLSLLQEGMLLLRDYPFTGLGLNEVPLVHSAWITAVLFSVANLLLLRERVRVEERALAAFATGGRP